MSEKVKKKTKSHNYKKKFIHLNLKVDGKKNSENIYYISFKYNI